MCFSSSLDQQALWACSSHSVTERQGGKSHYVSTFKAPAHVMSDNISLVKASEKYFLMRDITTHIYAHWE